VKVHHKLFCPPEFIEGCGFIKRIVYTSIHLDYNRDTQHDKKIVVKSIVLLVFIILFSNLNASIRALWVPIWEITSAEKVDAMMDELKGKNLNQLLIQVRYRGDAAYSPNLQDSTYANPEKRYHAISDSLFDPLEYIIFKAKMQNLEVHAWFPTFVITGHDLTRLDSTHVYFSHPEWVTSDFSKQPMKPKDDVGSFLDPGIPAVQDYTLNVILDIVSNYDIDGFHFDYIRYPESHFGFNELAMEAFQKEVKFQDAESWQNWKIDQVSRFVKRVNVEAKKIKPELQITAAVFPDPDNALERYLQNWSQWLEEGALDKVYLMAYTKSNEKLEENLTFLENYNLSDKIVVGLRAWNSIDDYSARDINEKLQIVKSRSFAGIALFSYSGLKQKKMFKKLKIN